ncbi:MAG: ammonium transporter [Actinomycetota bacterium]
MEGNIAWMLTSTALVLFMVPGLALFYGGMVRSKNTLNMLNMNTYCLGIVPLIWVLFTYSLGNSPNVDEAGEADKSGLFGGEFLGNFDAVGLKDLSGNTEALIFVGFLMTFAVITPALISGAVADRMKFSAWAVFVPVWSILVYTPVTYWVYNGWHTELSPEAIDFAGGTAIHINAGIASLALVMVLGKRAGWPDQAMPPHNLTYVMLGAGILWFGWFGFNAGSAGEASGQAVQAFLNTFVAAAAGMIAWLAVERIRDGHATTLGGASGVVAGLVAITPAAGYVGGLSPIIFGAVASVACYFAIQLKTRFGYDDSLDVVGIHMVGGIVGGVLLGFFADANIGGADGAFFGDAGLIVSQIIAIVSVMVFSFVVTYAIAKVLDNVMGLRVSDDEEQTGLDQTQHAETAYVD